MRSRLYTIVLDAKVEELDASGSPRATTMALRIPILAESVAEAARGAGEALHIAALVAAHTAVGEDIRGELLNLPLRTTPKATVPAVPLSHDMRNNNGLWKCVNCGRVGSVASINAEACKAASTDNRNLLDAIAGTGRFDRTKGPS